MAPSLPSHPPIGRPGHKTQPSAKAPKKLSQISALGTKCPAMPSTSDSRKPPRRAEARKAAGDLPLGPGKLSPESENMGVFGKLEYPESVKIGFVLGNHQILWVVRLTVFSKQGGMISPLLLSLGQSPILMGSSSKKGRTSSQKCLGQSHPYLQQFNLPSARDEITPSIWGNHSFFTSDLTVQVPCWPMGDSGVRSEV